MDDLVINKCNDIVSEASKKIQDIRLKIDEIKSSMITTQACKMTMDSIEIVSKESKKLDNTTQVENQKIITRLNQANQKVEKIKSNINISERRLEKLDNFYQSIFNKDKKNTNVLIQDDGEEGEINEMMIDDDIFNIDTSTSKFLIDFAENRNSCLQTLLDEIRLFINDNLINDIDEITNLQTPSLEQQKRIQLAISNAENKQKEALDENLKIQEKLTNSQEGYIEQEKKLNINALISQMQQQDNIISQIRLSDNNSRNETHVIKKARLENQDKHGITEENSLQNSQILGILDHSIEDAKGRNNLLKSRFEELSRFDGKEKNLISKIESNREARLKHKREKEGLTLSKEDKALLDMSMGMLRCSICHDRFKDVVLSKCLHLFCKICIDHKFSTKQRHCPTCGDKFNKADIKAVYFTH